MTVQHTYVNLLITKGPYGYILSLTHPKVKNHRSWTEVHGFPYLDWPDKSTARGKLLAKVTDVLERCDW